MTTISTKTKQLIHTQLQDWALAKSNYQGLQKVVTRDVELPGGSRVKVQFNPERIRSSAAKVDAKSIQERACFLCAENRPAQQQGVPFGDDYTILINPFPIFPQHLTIPHNAHTNQLIAPYFISMLSLAGELNRFTLFYNGPKCGASAPDHFHFQAGIKNFLPIEADFKSGKYTHRIGEENKVKVYNWKGYNRGVITLKGSDKESVAILFQKLHNYLHAKQIQEIEPMLNVLAYFEGEEWVVHIFPRILHRPACYFAQGREQILLSPASVDMAGVFITPRQEDFEKITANDITNILNQVCLSEEDAESAIKAILHV
ncbi:protein of unknown function [Saccharicrinis carchari]|uniref:GDP-D-glucose phosphorylase 1 n=1 Tax=Saccharicrinis carchari TaxID=1168039 RepID=A0A521B4A5_SACCC|nr:DUF4922 domain-containing protein [Saccharicrinis carchari]SMO41905.1 protein of unknown function [Saccharicrinis carchari]